MRKRKKGRKLKRTREQKKALLKGLASKLYQREKIKSTEERAKELKSFAEKFLTRAKKNDLASKRYLLRFFSKDIVKKLISELGPRYRTRPGGYTRIMKLGRRKSDGAKMAIIELVK